MRAAARLSRRCLIATVHGTEAPALGDVDPQLLAEVVRLNKVSIPVLQQLAGQDSNLKRVLKNHRMRTAGLNARAMRTSALVQSAFAEAGLNFLLYKGPPVHGLIYGDVFARPSGDVDVLVDRSKFRHAAAILQELGFRVADQSRSRWWSIFLGEQHFVWRDTSHSVVDLHYRLHQPGSPGPYSTSPFLARGESRTLSGDRLTTPAFGDVLTIACISIAKAIFNRQPCGGYVCDVEAIVHRMSPDWVEAAARQAAQEGMEGPLLLGLRARAALFGGRSALHSVATGFLASVTDEQLSDMILTPWLPDLRWPERREILWEVCRRRPGRFLTESLWALTSELGRRLLEERDSSREAGPERQKESVE